MTSIQELVEVFQISPQQLAEYLWRDCVFSIPDECCEYLESLTPAQLRAFGNLILAEADIKEEVADVA